MAVSIGDIIGTIKLEDAFSPKLEIAARNAEAFADKLNKVGSRIEGIGKTLTVGLTLPLAALVGTSVKAASAFESSFAGVRKTVDATEAQFASLSKQLRELAAGPNAVPIDINSLNKVAEAAGQLGILRQDIVAFTRTMADLGETTNLTADEAATAVAQFQNIFGAAGKDVDRFGSTLVALGNAGASTEKQIIEMGLRIAGAGTQIGLSQGEVLAFASALSSLGIDAEAGGSAISKIMIEIALSVSKGGRELNNFAAIAGTTADQFAASFRNDAAGAVEQFISGLGNLREAGGDVLGTLDAIGITEVRMRDALLRASGAGDLLTNSLALQSKAWSDNTALTKEAQERYKTFDSQLRLTKNQINDSAITLGTALLPAIRDLISAIQPLIDGIARAAERFSTLSEPVRATVLAITALVAAIGPALFVIGGIAQGIAGLTSAFAAVLPAIGSAVAVLTGPAGWIAAGVALLIAWKPTRDFIFDLASTVFDVYVSAIKGAIGIAVSWWDSIEDIRTPIAELAGLIGDFSGVTLSNYLSAIKSVISILSAWISAYVEAIKFTFNFARAIREDLFAAIGSIIGAVKTVIGWYVQYSLWVGRLVSQVADSIAVFLNWSGILPAIRASINIVISGLSILWQWLVKAKDKLLEWVEMAGGMAPVLTALNPALGVSLGLLSRWADRAKELSKNNKDVAATQDEVNKKVEEGAKIALPEPRQQSPLPLPTLLTDEQEAAIKSINDRIAAMTRERDAQIALLSALKEGPEAYLAEQRAIEIGNALFDARQELIEQGLSLSSELASRIAELTGSIFDSNEATAKFNALIDASNQSVTSSRDRIQGLRDAVRNLGSSEGSIRTFAQSFSASSLGIRIMQAQLKSLNPDTALAKSLSSQLAEEVRLMGEAYSDAQLKIQVYRQEQVDAARDAERAINLELDLIRERNEALREGQGSANTLDDVRAISARVSEMLSRIKKAPGETADEWAVRWLAKAREIRIELEREYDLEIAADLKMDLEGPLDKLRKYKELVDSLTVAYEDGAEAALTVAEAERLKAQATEANARQQINAWASFLGQLGDQLGGFFEDIGNLARAIQGVDSVAQSLGGWASVGGALGGTIAAFVVLYQYADAIITKHKGEKYGTRADYNVMGGVDLTGFTSQASMELGHQIKDILQALEDQLRISAEDLASLEIRISNDGKQTQAWVKGVWIGTFADTNTAIREALLVAMQDPASTLRGLSDLMVAGLADWTSPDMGGLLDFLTQLRAISDLDLSPSVISLQQSFIEINRMREALNKLDQSSQTVIDAHNSLTEAQKRLYDQTVNSMLGIDTAAADAVRNLVGFQKGIGDVAGSFEAGIQGTIAAIEEQIRILDKAAEKTGQLSDPEGRPGPPGGTGRGGSGYDGSGADNTRLFLSGVVDTIETERERLQKELDLWVKKLGEVPKALSEAQIDLGIFTAIESLLRKSGKHAELIAKFERMRIEAQFEQLRLQLIAAGAWERWAAVWQDLYNQAMAQAGQAPRIGRSGPDKSDIRADLLKQIADIEAGLKGPLHTSFLQFSRDLEEFKEQAKKGKLSAEDLARGIAALTEQFQRSIREQADAMAGIGTDFTRRLDSVTKFFKELRELGRAKTGMPNWLVDLLEGKALAALGKELNQAIAAFGGLVDPMLAITIQAGVLRENVLAFAAAAGWSAEQIAAANAAIDAGIEYQRQQGINSLLDRLFAWAKQAGILAKEAAEHERTKALLDLTVIEAQLRFFGALTAEIEGWINGIRNWMNSPAFGGNNDSNGGVQDVRVVDSTWTDYWDEVIDRIVSLVEDWRQAVKQLADSTANLMTDEALTNLTQEEQLAFAKGQVEDLAAKAASGDIEALAKLDAARAEYLKELRESEGAGFGFDQGWDWVMGLTAGILQNAQSIEDTMLLQQMAEVLQAGPDVMEYVMGQLGDQLEDAFYENTQDLIDAIYDAIAGVPGFAQGGIVMHGPRLVRVAEQTAEAIVPLDRLMQAVPYTYQNRGGEDGGRLSSSTYAPPPTTTSVYDQSEAFRQFQRQNDSAMRLLKIEESNRMMAVSMARMQQDMSAMRRRM